MTLDPVSLRWRRFVRPYSRNHPSHFSHGGLYDDRIELAALPAAMPSWLSLLSASMIMLPVGLE